MGDTWGYQYIFESSIQSTFSELLRHIGYEGSGFVELVALKWSADRESYDIVCSDELREFDLSPFLKLEQLAQKCYEAHPRYDLIHTDPRLHEQQQHALQENMRGAAIAQIFESLANGTRMYLDGHPTVVSDNEIYVVAGLDLATYRRVPQITKVFHDHLPVYPSFPYAVVRKFLAWTTRALLKEEPGLGAIDISPSEIARGALGDFATGLYLCAGQAFGKGAADRMSAISALPYEGRPGRGRIVVSKRHHPAIEVKLALHHPVALRNERAVRKLLEAGGTAFDLLSDGEDVYGLGLVEPKHYDGSPEDLFAFSIEARGVWTINHAESPLVRVIDGAPRLPKLPLDVGKLRDAIERLLSQGANLDELAEIALSLGRPEHGAMLVISNSAADEAQRLNSQAWQLLEPAVMSPELAKQLTEIDGAILIDPSGMCHAIGVILDGQACKHENSARGSRYNNAVRYVHSTETPPAVVVVYSADGSVDILPELMPRVRQSEVADAVSHYVDAVSAYIDGTDRPAKAPRRRVADARDAVLHLKFYLGAEQCQVVNKARDDEYEWARNNTTMQIIEKDVRVDPLMNDSYFLD